MRTRAILVLLTLAVSSCTSLGASPETTMVTVPTTVSPTTTSTSTSTTTSTTTTTTVPTVTITGTIVDPQGVPLPGVTVASETSSVVTGADGAFAFESIDAHLSISKPAWLPTELDWGGSNAEIELQPRVVRAVRVTRYNYSEGDGLEGILELIDGTTVNALVFDTKDETGSTLYPTSVQTANDIGAVTDIYDPVEVVDRVHELGLYAITRVVTFEDARWVRAQPEVKLAGNWADPTNQDNWEYPLGLAVEACGFGFDEIQFDYVRFPAGRTASAAPPSTQEERLAAISAFLAEAQARLHPLGCAVSADIFGIVTSSPTDEGIGQRPEEISAVTDAISPMVYPSHYSDGWLGFADPNDHPGPVTANALDGALPRMVPGALLRPWLQAFYYNSSEILAGINAAEERGVGWILWNAAGRYSKSALPVADE